MTLCLGRPKGIIAKEFFIVALRQFFPEKSERNIARLKQKLTLQMKKQKNPNFVKYELLFQEDKNARQVG